MLQKVWRSDVRLPAQSRDDECFYTRNFVYVATTETIICSLCWVSRCVFLVWKLSMKITTVNCQFFFYFHSPFIRRLVIAVCSAIHTWKQCKYSLRLMYCFIFLIQFDKSKTEDNSWFQPINQQISIFLSYDDYIWRRQFSNATACCRL